MKGKFASYLFKHAEFGNGKAGIRLALTDVIARMETEVLRGELDCHFLLSLTYNMYIPTESSIETDFSGTTFTCAVIRDNYCVCANIGDSRTTIGYRGATGGIIAEEITHDHKPDTPAEKARIEAKGGRVFAVEYDDGVDGPPRVWLGHMDVPGLAMSRSLCDSVAHTAGVSSEPEFFDYTFNNGREDLILVMASDGLWEFMSNKEVLDIAVTTTEPRFAVDRLISEANDRWMREEQVIGKYFLSILRIFLGSILIYI
jgi:serine/threonine protein phosphatase PrpC